MKIICATNMPFAQEAFSTLGATTIMEGRGLRASDVRDVDILALRSTTKVDAELLAGSKVRFVGTATIGTDHLDIPYLERQGIQWCFAPGCNANSVSEYITAALLQLAVRHGFTLAGKTIGVIGVGNVGRLVARKAQALGMRVLLNDPPRARLEAAPGGALAGSGFVDLERLLAEADIITMHVPLTKAGPDKTLHMANHEFFERAKRGLVFLNAARGPVVDSGALLKAMDQGLVGHAVLDTWEGEPNYRLDLQARVDIATPHIAGHSFEGKVQGTVMVYQAVCRFLGVAPTWSPAALLPAPLVPEVRVEAGGRAPQVLLQEVVRQVYDLAADDRRFRESAAADEKIRVGNFDRLRRDYPERREFQYTKVELVGGDAPLRQALVGLGFQL